MITCNTEGLNPTKAVALKRWLSQINEYNALKEVANGKAKLHLAKALNAALEGSRHEAKIDGANIDLQEAQRYQTFIDVLEEIAKQEDFQIVKLT